MKFQAVFQAHGSDKNSGKKQAGGGEEGDHQVYCSLSEIIRNISFCEMFDHVLRRKMKEYFCRGTTGEWVETEIDTSKIVRDMLNWKEEREKFLADALTSSTTVFPTSCSDEN